MKSERRKQRYTVTLFDCNQLAQVIVLWHIKKNVLLYHFCFVYFEGNFQVQAPGGFNLGGRFNGGYFALRGLEGLYLEGLIFGILRFLREFAGKACETKRAQDLNPFRRACQPLPKGLFVFAAAILENEKTLGTS